MVDKQKNVVYHGENLAASDISAQKSTEKMLDRLREEYTYVSTSGHETRWTYYFYKPPAVIESSVSKLLISEIPLIGFCVVIIIVLGMTFSKLFTRNIELLTRNMEQVNQGSREVTVYSDSQDEVGQLIRSFHHMMDEINRQIDEVYVNKIALKEYELKALQAQINPHFLYNTLDTIMWLAIDHQDDKVVEMVAALSGFFRTSLSHGEDKITIREELEHVENYLKIQQLRYGDIMEYSIDVPDEIKKNDIVKITLQPLVENALYHGLKKQREKGMIKISSVDDENNIFLIVEDNGVGMQPEQVVQINKEMYEDIWVNRTTGFGIANVNRRIKLYYGEEYGLILESEPDIGTKVIVVVPKTRQAEKK